MSISPGNSGGALLNGAGEVVGLSEAYIPPTAGAVSIGFAIPAATVLDVAVQALDRLAAPAAVRTSSPRCTPSACTTRSATPPPRCTCTTAPWWPGWSGPRTSWASPSAHPAAAPGSCSR
jgi:hypothetical protein